MNPRIAALVAATAATSILVVTPASAGISYSTVSPVKQDGPGLKNWRCRDTAPSPDWYGPWRYTKSGAFIDCDNYLRRIQ